MGIIEYIMGINEIRKIKATAKKKKPTKYKVNAEIEKKLKREKQDWKAKPDIPSELDIWFEAIKFRHWGINVTCPCMECGALIPSSLSRHATAHLLPKKLFKSVATHPRNYLILGASCCHDKTHRIDTFVKMKVWPQASIRIKEMIPFLDQDELKSLSYDLLKALETVK